VVCARASERAFAVLAPRCLSLLCYLFCFVTSRKQTNLRDENAKNEKRERERDRERTQSEIDYYCSRGLSASLEENFFFFFNSQSHWKRRSFFCHAATLRSLSLGEHSSLFPPALNLWFFCLLVERANFPDPFILNNFYQHFYPRVKYKNVHDDCEPTSCGCGDERYARKRANFQIFFSLSLTKIASESNPSSRRPPPLDLSSRKSGTRTANLNDVVLFARVFRGE